MFDSCHNPPAKFSKYCSLNLERCLSSFESYLRDWNEAGMIKEHNIKWSACLTANQENAGSIPLISIILKVN